MSADDIFFKILKFIVIVGILYFVITHFYGIFWVVVIKTIGIVFLLLSIFGTISFWEKVNIKNSSIKLITTITLFLLIIAIGGFLTLQIVPLQILDNLYGQDY